MPGINQHAIAEHGALNGEKIFMPVPAADVTSQRSDVDDQLMRVAVPAVAHDGIAAMRKHRDGGGAGDACPASVICLTPPGPSSQRTSGVGPPAASA